MDRTRDCTATCSLCKHPSMDMRIVIDVDDLAKAVAFYVEGLGLTVGRRFDPEWWELVGGSAPIDLLVKGAGTRANASATRSYERHWTPLHLDFVVDDVAAVATKLVAHGAKIEGGPDDKPWGRIALLSDPFGHGLCLLQFKGRGYDELR